MRTIAVLLAFALIFGCIGGEPEKPPVNESNETEIVVDIGPQENVTINETKPEPEKPVNETQPAETPSYSSEPDANLGIYFLDACNYGNGDHGAAVFIRKGDFDMLVDAGGYGTSGRITDWLKLRQVDDLDVVISTNADYRRYGGLDSVLDGFVVEEFWWGGDDFSDQRYSAVIAKAGQKAKKVRTVERGYIRELNGIKIEVLSPKTTGRFDDINNDAVVLKITDRDMVLLLTSGIQTGGQGDLINNLGSKIRDIDVMEAPYYGVGAGTANIALFIQATHPEYMVIEGCSDETLEVEGSTRNPFKRIMEQEQYNVEYFETYKDGTIRVMVDNLGFGILPLS